MTGGGAGPFSHQHPPSAAHTTCPHRHSWPGLRGATQRGPWGPGATWFSPVPPASVQPPRREVPVLGNAGSGHLAPVGGAGGRSGVSVRPQAMRPLRPASRAAWGLGSRSQRCGAWRHMSTPHTARPAPGRPMTPSRGLRSRRDPKRRCPSRLRPRALLESHLVRWYEEHSTRSPQERRGPCDGHRVPSRPPPRALPAAVLMPWRERTGGPEGRDRGEAWTPGLPPTLGPDWPCVLSAPPLVASLPGPQVTTQEMGSFRLQSPGGVGGDHSRAGHS